MRRLSVTAVAGVTALALSPGSVAAHVGSIEAATATPPVPTWFIAMTAGVVVGTSFLFTSLMADHETLKLINGAGLRSRLPSTLTGAAGVGLRALSLLGLAAIVAVGLFGPTNPQANAATLAVWVGWWGAFTMSAYLLGNAWPAVDPFRALAAPLSRIGRGLDVDRLGAWPAVVGVLAIVWLEVATAVTANPRWLAVVVLGYAAVVVLGSLLAGPDRWFEIDPLTWIFRTYGRFAPLQRTNSGLELRVPGAALTEREPWTVPGVPAFVVALLWATTFDGLVSTESVQAVTGPMVRAGVPAPILYLTVLLAGFGLFYWVYRRACRRSRETADTYVTGTAIERWFAPSLVPIAVGYHLAHFLGYVVSLAPAFRSALGSPFSAPPTVPILLLPDWFGLIQLSFVLVGHLFAIWVAHSIAFDRFPGVIQPIRSQYPMILVMIGYTMVSAWVVVSPATTVVV